MSYEKAMKHACNIRKIRKMSRGHYLTITHDLTPEQTKDIKTYQRKMRGK